MSFMDELIELHWLPFFFKKGVFFIAEIWKEETYFCIDLIRGYEKQL